MRGTTLNKNEKKKRKPLRKRKTPYPPLRPYILTHGTKDLVIKGQGHDSFILQT